MAPYHRMFVGTRYGRSPFRFRVPTYCHIVMITSLVWIFIDVLVLLYFTSRGEMSSESSAVAILSESNSGNNAAPAQPRPVPNPKHSRIGKHVFFSSYSYPRLSLNWFSVGALKEMYWRDKESLEGPGEQGKAYQMTEEEKKESKKTYAENQFNLFICQKMSLNRSLPDFRLPQWDFHFFFSQNRVALNALFSPIIGVYFLSVNPTCEKVLEKCFSWMH